MQQQLTKQKEEIDRLKKELEDFAYIASHDLQEPLRKIASFGERLSRDTGNFSDDQKLYLSRMLHATGRMQNMLDGLLHYSRAARQPFTYRNTDLNEVIKKVTKEMEEEIQIKKARIDIDTLPMIEAIPDQISTVFKEILSNSLKFIETSSDPHIEFSAQTIDKARVVQEELNPDIAYAMIQVKDNGIGFENEHAKRIFQPFQRLRGRSEYDGAGMGLAICQMIMTNHTGKIQAFSQPGIGTTIELIIPIQQAHISTTD